MIPKSLSRVLSLSMTLLVIMCCLFGMTLPTFAASENSSLSVVTITSDTVVIYAPSADYEYIICNEKEITIPEFAKWISPSSSSVGFTGLENDTTYTIFARNAKTWEDAGKIVVKTTKVVSLSAIVVILGILIAIELVYLILVMLHNSKARKLLNKISALAPISLLGIAVSAGSLYAIVIELIVLASVSMVCINIKKLDMPEEDDNAADDEEADEEVAEEVAEEVTEEATEEVAEEAAEEVAEEATEEVAEETTEEAAEEATEEATEEVAEEVAEEATDNVVEETVVKEEAVSDKTVVERTVIERTIIEKTIIEKTVIDDANSNQTIVVEPTVEETTEEAAEEATEEVAEEVAEEATEEVAEEVAEETTEEVAEEATEEVAEEATEEVTEEATEEVAEEVAEEATEEVAEEATEEVAEEATEEVAEETTEEVAEEATEEVAEEAAEEVAEEATEEVAEEATEEVAEEAAEEVAEEAAEEVAEEATEEVAEEATEEVAEEVTEEATEEVAEEVAEEATEEVAEEAAEVATEEAAEEVTEEVAEEVTEEVAEEVTEEVAEEATEEVAEEATEEVAEEVTEEVAEEVTEEPAAEAQAEPVNEKKSIINDDPAYAKLAVDERGLPITPEGMIIRYKWSFLARLYNSTDEIKYRYLVLRRLLLSYKKIRSNVSWNYDSFFLGRKQIAKIKIRGKALVVYLPLQYSDMENTKYRGKDVSKFARYKQVPFCYRVNGNRKLKYAMELIRQILADVANTEPEYVALAQIGEAVPYEEFDELYLEGLIKIGSIVPANGAVSDTDDDDDDDDTDDDIDEGDDDTAVDDEIASHIAAHVTREEFNFIPDKKRTTPIFEKVNASDVGKLMTDEEAKEALYDLTAPQAPVEETSVNTDAEGSSESAASTEGEAVSAEKTEDKPSTPIVEIKKKNPKFNLKRGKTEIVNIDLLNNNFNSGDLVTLKILKEKKLVPKNTTHIKVLARGTLDKSLTVCASQFSLDAIKMITLVGGNAVKTLDD